MIGTTFYLAYPNSEKNLSKHIWAKTRFDIKKCNNYLKKNDFDF
jgi:hypothetical protein